MLWRPALVRPRTLLVAALLLLITSGTAPAAVAAPPPTATGALAPSNDFNGDGFADLAVGAPNEQSVNVLYGSNAGLTAAGDQLWSQASSGVKGTRGIVDQFGAAVAGADFNGDGRDDLAIGVSGETVNRKLEAGAVNVLYGSARGLTAAGDQYWSQASTGVSGTAEQSDHFGAALATGNFNADRFADLAVASPEENVGSTVDAGSVTILYGSASGLRSSRSRVLTQASGGFDRVEKFQRFGTSLSSGDTDHDTYADLAIGAPGRGVTEERGNDERTSGGVLLLFGSNSGLATTRGQVWTQASPDVADEVEANDRFGASLSFGNFDGDEYADLAVGVPNETPGPCSHAQLVDAECVNVQAGAVQVLPGSASGLTGKGSQFWHKGGGGVPGDAVQLDRFGEALVAGDFDGDRRWELAITSGTQTQGRKATVTVLAGSPTGLTATGAQVWTQDSPGVPGLAEADDRFGDSLAVGNYSGGNAQSLAIGVPTESLGAARHAGCLIVLPASKTGLTSSGSRLWSQSSPGVRGIARTGEQFGIVAGTKAPNT